MAEITQLQYRNAIGLRIHGRKPPFSEPNAGGLRFIVLTKEHQISGFELRAVSSARERCAQTCQAIDVGRSQEVMHAKHHDGKRRA